MWIRVWIREHIGVFGCDSRVLTWQMLGYSVESPTLPQLGRQMGLCGGAGGMSFSPTLAGESSSDLLVACGMLPCVTRTPRV